MEEKVYASLILRPGIGSDSALLLDMIQDSIRDIRSFLNYPDDEELPDGCLPAVKELTLIRFNRDGTEGIQSESQSSGGSVTYMDTLPERIKRTIRCYRKLRR